MIPGWKIAREFDRLVQQIKAVFGLTWEAVVQWNYDRKRSRNLKIHRGQRPPKNKIAIFLIYQPKGILASTVQSCRHFEKLGYSVLIVSNSELNPAALANLQEVTWRVMERPNYGYDFGGYRDGVLHLLETDLTPDRLVILNDSTWIPLSEDDTLISRLETSGLDCAGTIIHHHMKSGHIVRARTPVIESYLFSFSKSAFKSEGFQYFWKKYRMSSNKYNAVHRGERRVAQAMLKSGLKTDGLFSLQSFMKELLNKDAAFLHKTLLYAAYTEEEFSAEGQALLKCYQEDDAWRLAALAHIEKVTKKRNFHGSFVYATQKIFQLTLLKKGTGTFLKKNYGTLYTRMRERYVAAVLSGDLPTPSPCVLSEIVQRDGLIAPSLPATLEKPI